MAAQHTGEAVGGPRMRPAQLCHQPPSIRPLSTRNEAAYRRTRIRPRHTATLGDQIPLP